MTRNPGRDASPGGRGTVAALLVACLIAGAAGTAPIAAQAGSPSREAVKRLVVREAKAMRVPVALALAVAHAESDFDPWAESVKGARGVMQVMPATAIQEYGIAPEMLWNPRINIRLGLHYLRRLIERYDGRTDLALSFYNGGSAVGTPGNARVLPATRSYVREVRRLTAIYRRVLRRGAA